MFAALLILAAQTVAPAAPVSSASQPAHGPTPTSADHRVCRAEASTGSIMPPRRICHLQSEWAAIDAANGRSVDTFRNRPQGGLTPGS